MYKYGMFAFIFALFGFVTKISFAEDMGGGSDGEGDSSSNEENTSNDEGGNDDNVGDVELGEGGNDSDTALSSEEVQALRDIANTHQQQETLKTVESSIQSRVPNFKMDAVVKGLRELNKTDPQKAAYYNASEAGLEMYHRDHLANIAQSDSVNSGSHSGSDGDIGEILQKARGGHKRSIKLALANSKA